MPKLHLGVLDLAYADSDSQGETTGDVAGYIENKFHVMRIFVEENMDDIALEVGKRLAGEIESLVQGRPPIESPVVEFPKVEMMFRDFLDSNEIQTIFTHRIVAADKGYSTRKKKKGEARPPRPAFIDTGLYQTSFRSWMDKK